MWEQRATNREIIAESGNTTASQKGAVQEGENKVQREPQEQIFRKAGKYTGGARKKREEHPSQGVVLV